MSSAPYSGNSVTCKLKLQLCICLTSLAKYLGVYIRMYADLVRDVARCKDGENAYKVCVLKPANVDQVDTTAWDTPI